MGSGWSRTPLFPTTSTVTSITTSIHLPDGTLARTNGSSAVIYKIVKMNNAPFSILNDFVKPGKKGEKKK